MKTYLFGFAASSLPSFGSAPSANPVNKVVQLLTDLEAKINAEGVEAHRAHEELAAWCKTQSSDLAFAAWSFKWVSSDQDWRSRGQCRDNGGRLDGRCRNSCKGTCRLRKVAKGIVGRHRHVGNGDRHHRKGDERRIFDDAIAEGYQRPRGSQCSGAGIVDQFCRRHQTDGAGAKYTEFWWYGRHRRRGRFCCVCVQESLRVHRGDFGLKIEGRVAACRSSPDWNDSQPQLADAPTIFGGRLEVQRTGSRSCQTFFGWDAGPVDHRHRRFEDDGRRSYWRYSSTSRYNARLPVKSREVWGRRQESVWGVGGACEGENRDLREDGRIWILHLRFHSNLVSWFVSVSAFVARRPDQIRSSWRSSHFALLPRCTPSRQMATIFLPRWRVWSARWSRGWKTRRLRTLPTRPTVTKSFPRAGRRRRQKLLSSRSFLPQSTRKLQNLLSSRDKFQSCRHPWASSQRPRLPWPSSVPRRRTLLRPISVILKTGLRAFAPLWESYVTTTEEPTQRTQLQERAEESLDCAR